MDIEKQQNFVPVDEKIKDKIFLEDDNDKKVLIIKTNKDGLKYSLEGEMNFGAVKASRNKLRFVFSFIKKQTDNFVIDLDMPIKKNIEKIESFLNQDNLYVSFFYYEDDKLFYGFSKSFKIKDSQKKEIFDMFDPQYPIIHKIDITDFKLKNILADNYYQYKLKLEKIKPSKYFLDILKNYSKNSKNINLWFDFDKNYYYIYADKKLKEKKAHKKYTNPLKEGALPFGVVKEETIFLLIINSEGLQKLSKLAGHTRYEKKYNLWN